MALIARASAEPPRAVVLDIGATADLDVATTDMLAGPVDGAPARRHRSPAGPGPRVGPRPDAPDRADDDDRRGATATSRSRRAVARDPLPGGARRAPRLAGRPPAVERRGPTSGTLVAAIAARARRSRRRRRRPRRRRRRPSPSAMTYAGARPTDRRTAFRRAGATARTGSARRSAGRAPRATGRPRGRRGARRCRSSRRTRSRTRC